MRGAMGWIATCLVMAAGCAGSGEHADADKAGATGTKVTSAEARRRLAEGNTRYAGGKSVHPHQGTDRRAEVAGGQRPFAIIVGCSDSRTGPEVIFDQGLGDLFVVRVAGNVVDDHAIGSVEYAVEHLHAGTIVVLGHEKCGAVAAAREVVASNGNAPGHVDSIVRSIAPAVLRTQGQDAEATCRENVRNVARALRESGPILKQASDKGEITVLGAYYDLDTGVVTFLND